MRIFLTLPFLLLTVLCFGQNKQYHIRVECWREGKPEYKIMYTADNWKTSNTIKETFDISDVCYESHVCYQEYIEVNKSKAINEAKKYKSYKDCIFNNTKALIEYKRLKEIRDAEYSDKCCKTTEVY